MTVMTPIAWLCRALFAAVIDPIIEKHGGQVTSWDRDVEKNSSVGGTQFSFHLQGLAKDVVNLDDVDEFIADCFFAGLEAVNEGDHVHVEMDLKAILRRRLAERGRGDSIET